MLRVNDRVLYGIFAGRRGGANSSAWYSKLDACSVRGVCGYMPHRIVFDCSEIESGGVWPPTVSQH